MEFYKLDVPSFTQYKYAWAEPAGKPKISDDCERCPKCNRPVSLLFYVPPFNIEIKQPRRIGDFVGGIIPFDLVVSERFMKEYLESNLNGILDFFELSVVKVGSKGSKDYDGPRLFSARIERPLTQVDYKKMDVKWDNKPTKGYCELCGPGGGGDNGTLKSYQRISVIENTWTGLDLFIPINFSGNILITKKAKEFIENNSFQNYQITIDKESKFDFYNPIK